MDKDRYFAVPTIIYHFLFAFGETKPEVEYMSTETERCLLIQGINKDAFLIQQSLEPAKKFDQQSLRVLLALFHLAHIQGNSGYCYYDPHELLLNLGYKPKDKNLKAEPKNILYLTETLNQLENTYLYIERTDNKYEDKVIFQGRLIHRSDDIMATTDTEIRDCIYIYGELFDSMRKIGFALLDERCLKISTKYDGKSTLLYTYYSLQLAMGASKKRYPNIVVKRLSTVLNDTGIQIERGTGKHFGRDKNLFEKAHIMLKDTGIIQDYSISWKSNTIAISFDRAHPSIKKLKG